MRSRIGTHGAERAFDPCPHVGVEVLGERRDEPLRGTGGEHVQQPLVLRHAH
jgi:hypothetical protein